MYELGALMFPNDVLELAMCHNRSFFPLDSKPRGYSFDPQHVFVHFQTAEDLGTRPIPLEAEDGEFHVGGELIESPNPKYHTIAISWGQVFNMLKQHATGVPLDSELREVQVKQGPGVGDVFHLFRLAFRTEDKDTLQFDAQGKPKDLYIKPARVAGELSGELRFIGARSN